jgi:SAM-dependent methyltransferase
MAMGEPDMSVDAATSWEDHYRRGDTGWDLGQAAPPLERWLAQGIAPPPPRQVAVLGCGFGHDALLFARAGYTVTGFDFAPSAVQAARSHAAAAGLPVRFEEADIFTLAEPCAGMFDLVVEHTCFCAINPQRRAEYVAVAHHLLAAGGTFVGLFWAHGRPGGPPFSTSGEEITALFTPSFVIHSLDKAPDSVPRRAHQELLAVMTPRGVASD